MKNPLLIDNRKSSGTIWLRYFALSSDKMTAKFAYGFLTSLLMKFSKSKLLIDGEVLRKQNVNQNALKIFKIYLLFTFTEAFVKSKVAVVE